MDTSRAFLHWAPSASRRERSLHNVPSTQGFDRGWQYFPLPSSVACVLSHCKPPSPPQKERYHAEGNHTPFSEKEHQGNLCCPRPSKDQEGPTCHSEEEKHCSMRLSILKMIMDFLRTDITRLGKKQEDWARRLMQKCFQSIRETLGSEMQNPGGRRHLQSRAYSSALCLPW
ncbi:uncharacterized protein LOC128327889 isoform X3 [Hemicordylus capensis]|nr:uncharacterized protein LOC128327889 isoform X3 [Hemicordylus capensis]